MSTAMSSLRIGSYVAGLALAGSALAADSSTAPTPTSRYQQERATCLAGQTNQDRETCLREAGAALQEARRGALAGAQANFDQNRLARCDVHKTPQDRDECIKRMNMGSTTGSVEGGGMYRELTTREAQAPR